MSVPASPNKAGGSPRVKKTRKPRIEVPDALDVSTAVPPEPQKKARRGLFAWFALRGKKSAAGQVIEPVAEEKPKKATRRRRVSGGRVATDVPEDSVADLVGSQAPRGDGGVVDGAVVGADVGDPSARIVGQVRELKDEITELRSEYRKLEVQQGSLNIMMQARRTGAIPVDDIGRGHTAAATLLASMSRETPAAADGDGCLGQRSRSRSGASSGLLGMFSSCSCAERRRPKQLGAVNGGEGWRGGSEGGQPGSYAFPVREPPMDGRGAWMRRVQPPPQQTQPDFWRVGGDPSPARAPRGVGFSDGGVETTIRSTGSGASPPRQEHPLHMLRQALPSGPLRYAPPLSASVPPPDTAQLRSPLPDSSSPGLASTLSYLGSSGGNRSDSPSHGTRSFWQLGGTGGSGGDPREELGGSGSWGRGGHDHGASLEGRAPVRQLLGAGRGDSPSFGVTQVPWQQPPSPRPTWQPAPAVAPLETGPALPFPEREHSLASEHVDAFYGTPKAAGQHCPGLPFEGIDAEHWQSPYHAGDGGPTPWRPPFEQVW